MHTNSMQRQHASNQFDRARSRYVRIKCQMSIVSMRDASDPVESLSCKSRLHRLKILEKYILPRQRHWLKQTEKTRKNKSGSWARLAPPAAISARSRCSPNAKNIFGELFGNFTPPDLSPPRWTRGRKISLPPTLATTKRFPRIGNSLPPTPQARF